ncbi:MAG TPA: hypothetical protein VM580_17710, partial [Labilithrix sp.]|nr:hypothetical protein [Labilithrix sp.]
MAESPHGRGAPNADDGANEAAPRKRAESDSLIPPGGLKPRRTVMGLAPAPHLGGASRAGSNESESRKARVAQRLAEIDAAQPRPTGPPAPAERVDSEPPFSTTWKGPPPPLPTPVTGQTGAPPTYESTPPGYASAPPRTGPPARTGPPPPAVTGPPPPVFGTTTMLMPERARLLSEAGRPSSGGRDVHPPAPDLAARTASNASDAVIEVEAS